MGGNINDHIVSFGEWGAELRCTPLVIDAFKRRKIWVGFETDQTHAVSRSAGEQVFRFASGVSLEPYVCFQFPGLWNMGAFSYSGSSWAKWAQGVTIGRYCSIALGCRPIGSRHPIEWAVTALPVCRRPEIFEQHLAWIQAAHDDFNSWTTFDIDKAPIRSDDVDINIRHDVWIGEHVRLAQHVAIGTGAVIATGAIVTRDVEPYMIVGGVPARTIRPRFQENLVEKLLATKWWEFGPDLWKFCDYKNPAKFVDDVARVKDQGTISPYSPERITYRHIVNEILNRL